MLKGEPPATDQPALAIQSAEVRPIADSPTHLRLKSTQGWGFLGRVIDALTIRGCGLGHSPAAH